MWSLQFHTCNGFSPSKTSHFPTRISSIFHVFQKSLPGTVFRGSQCRSFLHWSVFVAFSIFGISRKGPLGRHLRPKGRQKPMTPNGGERPGGDPALHDHGPGRPLANPAPNDTSPGQRPVAYQILYQLPLCRSFFVYVYVREATPVPRQKKDLANSHTHRRPCGRY